MSLIPEVKKHYGKLQFLINGEWVDSSSNDVKLTVNPATGDEIANVPSATNKEASKAVESAYNSFKSWKDVPLRDRARLLFRLHSKLVERYDELCRVLTQDHGRTIGESRGSVSRVIENVESACSALYGLAKQNEHIDQLANGIDEYLIWEPLGPFLIITPGNIPMHAWSSFVPYALAAGCTVIISPSSQAPVAADTICRAAHEVGFPPGVLNMVHGGRHINNDMLSMPQVKGVGFIGSNRVGHELFATCGKLLKSSSINGNGKNHVVVMPDANLDECIPWLLRACFGMTGQRCLGADNIVAIGNIYDELKYKFSEAAASMKLGYGLDETVALGPYTTESGRDSVESWIERAIADGAKLVLDGRSVMPSDYPNGYFMGPTILEEMHVDMPSAKEEAFGAVAGLIRGDSLDKTIEWINTKTNLGHSACIMTEDMKAARKFTREVNVGNVGVNVGVAQPYAFFPLGSRRESFLGTAKSRISSMRLFMDEKTITSRWI